MCDCISAFCMLVIFRWMETKLMVIGGFHLNCESIYYLIDSCTFPHKMHYWSRDSIFQNELLLWHLKWATSWQNQQNELCTQRRTRSAWASTQSDESLSCELNRKPRLIWVFVGCTFHFVGFLMRWFKCLSNCSSRMCIFQELISQKSLYCTGF